MDLIYFYKNPNSDREKVTAAAARKLAEERYARQRTGDLRQAAYVCVFGGDGTMLGALKTIAEYQRKHPQCQPKVIGFNYGDVGFLMNQPIADLHTLFKKADTVVLHPLEAHITDENGEQYNRLAFNEVVVRRSSASEQSCQLDVLSKGDRPVHDIVKGDGIMVSAPVGSHAYYYDAGGEPFDIRSSMIGLQPICDRASAKKIAGTYPDTQKIQINVLNHNQKRPAYANTDNDERIDNVFRCDVVVNKKISIPLLMGPLCPARGGYSR